MPNFGILRKLSRGHLRTTDDTSASTTNSSGQTKRRRKSSSALVLHKGSLDITVVGDRSIGKRTLCRTFTQQEETMKENEVLNCTQGVMGEQRFTTSMILPNSHYDVRLSVVSTDWCKKNVRNYRDLVLSSDGFLLTYRKSKRESFISLIESVSDIKHFRGNSAPLIVANITATDPDDENDVRKEDLLIIPEESVNVTLEKPDEIESLFRMLAVKCIVSNQQNT